ncbi:MAG TPA: DinB family protein [Vicinamibacteria bacterium]|nr:DinB family protein [Vicinamibacteria bacterium]
MTSTKIREILQTIDRDRSNLLSAVEGLQPGQLGHRELPEAWSIEDVLHHLALADESSAKLMALMLRRAREESLPPDPSPDRSVLDSIDEVVARAENQKAKAPDRVTPRSRIEVEESLSRLRLSRDKIETTVEALSAFDLSLLTFPHPFFGELNTYQWLLVTGWHERRHTRQIERVKSSPGFPGGAIST